MIRRVWRVEVVAIEMQSVLRQGEIATWLHFGGKLLGS